MGMKLFVFGLVLIWTVLLASSLGFIVRRVFSRKGWVDQPDAQRRTHASAIPFGGGLVAWMTCTFVIGGATLFLVSQGMLSVSSDALLFRGLLGAFFASIPLLIVGTLDDRYRLSPYWLSAGAILSVLIALLYGIRIQELTRIGGSVYVLSTVVSFLLTGIWLLLCIGATKFSDGIDGLVCGQTCVGAVLIAGLALSPAFRQLNVAFLAIIFGGAFFGVLLHNWPKARIYLGEFGSTFSGLGLGILAILSGAKLAIALMAFGPFLADIARVMVMRVLSGQSPFVGDRRHLHFLLRDAGLPAWAVSLCMWVFALIFGLSALQFQTQGKILLLATVLLLTWGGAFALERQARRKTV